MRVSLLGTGTVSRLGRWEVRRFRPNIVLDGADEDGLVGRRVGLGGAILDIVQPVKQTIVWERGGNLVVGALVVAPETVRVGDEVEVEVRA